MDTKSDNSCDVKKNGIKNNVPVSLTGKPNLKRAKSMMTTSTYKSNTADETEAISDISAKQTDIDSLSYR